MAISRKIIVKTGLDRYPVIINPTHNTLAKTAALHRRLIIISNARVYALRGREFTDRFIPSGIDIDRLLIGDGEKFKSRRTMEILYDQLFNLNAGRDDLIIAFGGGVVGDIAGFAAATFMRGMDYIQVPTTLLAMVDSAIGGKVGINHRRGKNLIGAFYNPKMVLIDPCWLTTLGQREMVEGLAEVIKTGFLTSDKILRKAVTAGVPYATESGKTIRELLTEVIKFKIAVVAKDDRDLELRHILNFGHTFGHAIENVEKYSRYRHGEGVLAGMVGAIYLSHFCGCLDKRRLQNFLGLLSPWMNYLAPLKRKAEDYLLPMRVDKKKYRGKTNFVLLAKPGTLYIRSVESERVVLKAIEMMIGFVNNRGEL